MSYTGAFAVAAVLLGPVTYQADVKPLLDDRCAECHHGGGQEPDLSAFPFRSGTTADQAAIAAQILVMTSGEAPKMPPGTRPKLSAPEVATLSAWKDGGLLP